MNYRAVLFDLDGTLVDSLEDIGDSMNKVLQQLGFPTHDLQAYRYFVGNGIKNLVQKALPEGQEEEFISQCFEAMMEEYGKHCVEKTKLYDGISELLDELSAQQIRLAIFSNKVHELTEKVVQALLSRWKFEIVLGATAEIPRKPDPTGAQFISRKMGIRPEEFLYLGDTSVDMETANQTGMYSVGVLWGFRTQEELVKSGAKRIISHPLELLELV